MSRPPILAAALCLLSISAHAELAGFPEPTELQVNVASTTEVALQWKDSVPNKTGFRVERRLSGTNEWQKLGVLPANTNSFKDSGLTAGKTYIYRVYALNGGGESKPAENRVTVGLPEFPSGLLATTATSTEVYLTWIDRADNETQYLIDRRTKDGQYQQVAVLPANTIFHLDTGLKPGRYFYRVHAVNPAGSSGYCQEFGVNVTAASPGPAIANGLRGEFFANATLEGTPMYVWTDPVIDYNWKAKGPSVTLPADNFSVRWTGKIAAPTAGEYIFTVTADEGVRLFLGENKLIDTWANPSGGEKTAKATFAANTPQPIRLEYYDKTGDAGIRLQWSGPNIPKHVIPPARMTSYSNLKAKGEGIQMVGTQDPMPASMATGAGVEFTLWQWKDKNNNQQLHVLKDGAKIPTESLPEGINFQARAPIDHDTVFFTVLSSDGPGKVGWGPSKPKSEKLPAETLYRISPFPSPRQAGKYCLEFKAEKAGKIVAHSIINIELVAQLTPPVNTTITKGMKDISGNEITWSAPKILGPLNQTAKLVDNDYVFEPQHAYNVINWERFPPFQMAKKFWAVWNSRRFPEENKFGGPMTRGFTTMAIVKSEQDNLTIPERCWWYTPDLQVNFIKEWSKKEPEKFKDLAAYAEYRNAFVCPENAAYLGWVCYNAWGAGGWGPYDAGIYGWDEEQMGTGIAHEMASKHPDMLPLELRELKDKAIAKDPATLGLYNTAYTMAQGDFVGHTYRGAREAAAQRGRTFKVWHYGTGAPCIELFLGKDQAKPDANGEMRFEKFENLTPWFKDKKNKLIDFDTTEFARQIDYFHHDWYYHTVFPHAESIYEKDKSGNYVLEAHGRRKIRRDVIKEKYYVEPIKIGYEDFDVGPMFLKAYIAKEESNQFWFNGGKYYKRHGTKITDKSLVPAQRPGNQETWAQTAQFGQRPVTPYLTEAAAIFNYMCGAEGLYYWDANNYTAPIGRGNPRRPDNTPEGVQSFGDIEFTVKGMHRVSQLNALFEGNYSFVRPTRTADSWDRDNPVIRGIINGQYLALAMTNAYLEKNEVQEVEIWYDAPYEQIARARWRDKVSLQFRRTHLFQCKLPALPGGEEYDPDRLYFRYSFKDGKHSATYTVTGNYEVPYPY